jgi:hypothetical protein
LHGTKAKIIQELSDNIAIDQRDIDNIEADLEDYGDVNDNDGLSAEEVEEYFLLHRRLKQAK